MVHVDLRDDRGVVIVLFALVLVVIMVMTAFAIDLGNLAEQKRLAQGVVDGAALAAAQDLPDGAVATSTAATYAAANLQVASIGTGSSCGTNKTCYTSGAWTIDVTTPYSGSSDQIQVHACVTLNTSFARVVGIATTSTCANAVASSTSSGGGSCVLCVLNATGTTLSSTGSGWLSVNNGNIVVNSSASNAVSVTNPSGKIQATPSGEVFGIVGNYSVNNSSNVSPTPTTGYTAATDPLASLAVPSVSGSSNGNVSVSGSSSTTLNPGIYDTISSSSSGTITLNPGIYVIRNGLTLNHTPGGSSPSLYAHGVLLYFACSAYPTPCNAGGQNGAAMNMNSGATADMTGPTSGTYQGISIFSDRTNTATHAITGSSSSAIGGTIYSKTGTVSFTGPSGITTSLSAAVVAGVVTMTGSGNVTLNFNSSSNAPALSGAASITLTS